MIPAQTPSELPEDLRGTFDHEHSRLNAPLW